MFIIKEKIFVSMMNLKKKVLMQILWKEIKTSFVRTYERGVENETLSCGTGVVASAIAAHLYSKHSKFLSYNIKTLGGILKVKFNKISDKFVDIYLEGPSTFVYKGEIDI